MPLHALRQAGPTTQRAQSGIQIRDHANIFLFFPPPKHSAMRAYAILSFLVCAGSGLAAITTSPSSANGKTFDYIVVRTFN